MNMLIGLVLAGVTILFALQNAEPVEFRFLVWAFSLSRAFVVFIVLAIGMALGWILHSISMHRRTKRRRAAQSDKHGKTELEKDS